MLLNAPPKKFKPSQIIKPRKAKKRITVLSAVVSHNQAVRKIEAFHARPSLNKKQIIIGSENSSFKFLRLCRVLLDKHEKGYNPQKFVLKNEEAAYYVNYGKAIIVVAEKKYTLRKGDVLYVGINNEVSMEADSIADVSEYKAIDCNTAYPTQLITHKKIEKSAFATNLGSKRFATKRTVYKLIDGGNLKACRLLFGDTYVASPGAVGSYPPHFHGPKGKFGFKNEAKEEIYHFRIQSTLKKDNGFILQNCQKPEEPLGSYFVVTDDTAVNVTHNYHDTIAPPAVEFMFVWCLASFKEGHRDWSQVFNKPGYENEW